MDSSDTNRLRQSPSARFAGPQHRFDLAEVAARLRAEVRAGQSKHRQESLYKKGPISVALFLFAAGAGLAPHRTHGTVFIQVIKGRLTVTAGPAPGTPNDLGPGGLLVLVAGVEHGLLAHEESEMLLTVHLETSSTT
jgi:quercetin dioxygenase-like cupin family protein